ncbi:MAG: penicillin-binding protein activator [Pseudomonadota bacterium]
MTNHVHNIVARYQATRNWVAIICTCLLLSGCVTTPYQQLPSNSQNHYETYNNVGSYLSKAHLSAPKAQAFYLFKASEMLVEQEEYERAKEILEVIFIQELEPDQRNQYHVLYALALTSSFPTESVQQLSQVTLSSLSDSYLVLFYKAKAISYTKIGDGPTAFQAAIELRNRVTNLAEQEEAKTLLWQGLIITPYDSLNYYRQTYYEPALLGWIDLAILYQQFSNSPDELLVALRNWRQSHSNHEAYAQLPDELKLAERAQPYEINQIALLLPFKGPYNRVSKAIRDGFMHAHLMQSRNATLKVYDTSDYYSIITAYQKSIDEGADFIVGPLTKRNINELVAFYDALPKPTLTLNRLENLMRNDELLYQFGLPIEDEAKQVAARAWNDGKRKAVVMAPKTNQGQRAIETFEKEFAALGGEIVANLRFKPGENHQTAIKEILGVDKSERRKNTIRYLLGEKLEFEPRRRQDADFIFLASSHRDARQIKPFLNYYYAIELDVYATSTIFSGALTPTKDKDLNGIVFCDIPWLIDKSPLYNEQRNLIADMWPQATQSQARYFSLGHDAYAISRDLSKLRAYPRYRLEGLSGKLSVNQTGTVERDLSWAIFKQGRPQQIQ